MVEWRYALSPISRPADLSLVFRIERVYLASYRNADGTDNYSGSRHNESNFHLC